MNYQKYEKDGMVAVLVSPGYGAGWSTWVWSGSDTDAVIFDKNMVELILDDKREELDEYVAKTYPDVYTGGVEDLTVMWVPKGEAFEITEYDGYESLNIIGQQTYHTA